jgi:hypothetical protein
MIELLYGKDIQYLYYPSFAIAENCPYIRRIKNNPTMADINQTSNTENFLEEPKKLPSMLNVLTVLTFIGSGLGLISGLYGFFAASSNYDKAVQTQDKLEQMPDWVKSMTGPNVVEAAHRQLENRLPIMLLTIVASVLCLYGAIQMRNYKKNGFSIYVIGDLLAFVTMGIFIGFGYISSFALVFTIVITALFIGLYATQLKYLK